MSRAGRTGKQPRNSAVRTRRSGPPRRLPLSIKEAAAAVKAPTGKAPPELEAALHAEPRPNEITARPPIRGPPIPHACFSVQTFCAAHLISEAMYFKMKGLGLGPREMRVGRRVLITFEAAAEWRAQREVTTAAE